MCWSWFKKKKLKKKGHLVKKTEVKANTWVWAQTLFQRVLVYQGLANLFSLYVLNLLAPWGTPLMNTPHLCFVFFSFNTIIAYIDDQFERYLHDESGLNRRHIVDNRVHCCFYFISPLGHGSGVQAHTQMCNTDDDIWK